MAYAASSSSPAPQSAFLNVRQRPGMDDKHDARRIEYKCGLGISAIRQLPHDHESTTALPLGIRPLGMVYQILRFRWPDSVLAYVVEVPVIPPEDVHLI
jgi:hypothetical protein